MRDAIGKEHFTRAEDLFELLSATEGRWIPDLRDWMFRGQADEWPLVPSCLRTGDGGPPPWRRHLTDRSGAIDEHSPSHAIRSLAEFNAVDEFMRAADRCGLTIPDDSQALRTSGTFARLVFGEPTEAGSSEHAWPVNEILSVVGLAQHFGIPTRLLDWSWKPKVAAYLAARGAADPPKPLPGERLVVWATRTHFVDWVGRYRGDGGMVIVTAPQASNPNLAAQAGLFTLVRSAHEGVSFDALMSQEIAVGHAPEWLLKELPAMWKLTLPHSEARRLLRLLGLDGVNAATVFPGYGGVVKSLQEQRLWEK